MARRGLLAVSPPRHIRLGQVIVSEGTHLQQGGGCKAGGTGWGYGRESKAAAAAGPRRERGSGCALALKLPVGTQGSRRPQQPWWGPCKKSHRVWDGQSHAHKVQLVFGTHNVSHSPLRVQREGGTTCVLSSAAATEAGWPWDGTTTWQPHTMPAVLQQHKRGYMATTCPQRRLLVCAGQQQQQASSGGGLGMRS